MTKRIKNYFQEVSVLIGIYSLAKELSRAKLGNQVIHCVNNTNQVGVHLLVSDVISEISVKEEELTIRSIQYHPCQR